MSEKHNDCFSFCSQNQLCLTSSPKSFFEYHRVCVSCSLSSICALLALGINELLLSFGAQHANKQLEIRQPRGCCGVGEHAKCCDYILTSPFWEEWASLMLLKGGSCSGRQTKETLHAPVLWYVQSEGGSGPFCGLDLMKPIISTLPSILVFMVLILNSRVLWLSTAVKLE